MKKCFPMSVVLVALSIFAGAECFAANNIGGSNSGATNANYACQPPYLTQSAKPNIHFVLDYTGSMNYYPYIQTSSTYSSSTSFYGYFKQDMYYKYDTTTVTGMSPTTGFWTENTSCTDTDYIGRPGCVSGRLLNYLTSNKVDILRKVLTGGRVAAGSTDVLEHDAGDSFSTGRIGSEPTTQCLFDAGPSSLTGQEQISSTSYTIDSTSTTTDSNLRVDVSATDETFTRGSGDFTTKYAVGDTVQVTRPGSSAISTNNDGTFTVTAVSQYKLTVNGNLGTTESNKYANFIKITYTAAASGCQVLAKTIRKTMTISGKTFTRTDGGSFLTDGWAAGMTFVASGFRSVSNNGTFSVASVTDSTLTVNENTPFSDSGSNTGSFLQSAIYPYTRVKTSTPSDITGTIQYVYTAPNSTANKADMEISFYSTSYGVTYGPTIGGTSYNTTKNQAQSNYINAINLLPATGGTNTRQALSAAEKFFQGDNTSATGIRTVASMPSGWPAAGSAAKGDYRYDPFYDSGNVATPCRKSFVLLATDGDWNEPDTTYASDPAYIAYDMHVRNSTYDLRPESYTGTMPVGYDTNMVGLQNVTTYGIYLLDDSVSGKNALKTLAIYGGFNDSDKNNLPYPFTTAPPNSSGGRYKTVANTTGWSTSLNVPYPLTECNDPTRWDSTSTVTCKEWDTSPKAAGVNHTNLPYNYFEASDGDQVASSILNAVNDIIERVSSGTAASILGNNDNAGSQLLQAMFYPIKTFENYTKATWLGELQSYWYFVDPTLKHVTIREDSVNDLKLNLTEDRIVEFNFDGTYTKVRLYKDVNGDGTKDSTTFETEVDPDDVKTLWQAGTKLFCTDESDRVIFTNDPTTTSASKLSFNDSASSGTTTAKLRPYLDVTSNSGAYDVIKYTRGSDVDTAYRNRTVRYSTSTCTGSSGTYTKPWKLGDIVNSTPKILTEVRLNSYNLSPAAGYADTTYTKFINSIDYNARGLAFVGANDGMLHAFKTGSNFSGNATNVVAQLGNSNGSAATDLGKELWAFIPKNVLPYLQYLSLSNYSHMYFVDSTPIIADVSINVTSDAAVSCTSTNYSACALKTTLSGNNLSYDTGSGGTSWRTLLIGSMGQGGATRVNPVSTASTSITVNASGKTFTRSSGNFLTDGWTVGKVFTTTGFTNTGNAGPFSITSVTSTVITCSGAGLVNETASAALSESQAVRVPVTTPTGSTTPLGYSSVFALDITAPSGSTTGTDSSSYPQLLWEFTDPRMGFATVTPAIMRLKDPGETPTNPTRRNGKWYAILASGPTGPISGGNFYGNSDLPLTIFVLDLKTGNIVRSFNNLASSHTLNAASSTVHTQVTAMPSFAFGGSLSASGIDVEKKSLSQTGNYSDDALYIGFTKADFTQTPAQWNKGGVLRLLTYNDPDPSHWSISPVIDDIGPVTSAVTRLQDITAHNLWLYFGTGRYFSKGDDQTNIQSLFGIKEPCYAATDTYSGSVSSPCVAKISATSTSTGISGSTLVNQTTSPVTTLPSGKDGWFINLGTPPGNYAKRVVTDPIASYNGMVTFSTFAPSTDVCSYGGSTSVWEVQYNTGAAPPASL